nr:MAG TPA: hypothetical protein [Caudoviricetes sp.]
MIKSPSFTRGIRPTVRPSNLSRGRLPQRRSMQNSMATQSSISMPIGQ